MLKTIGSASLGIAVVALSACKQDSAVYDIPYTDGLAGVWSEMLSPYGMLPLFPIRTHMQPGDIWVKCKKELTPTAEKARAQAAAQAAATGTPLPAQDEWVKVGALSTVREALERYAKTRMAFGSFESPKPQESADGTLGPAHGADPYATDVIGDSIGFASFPSILSYTQKRTDFGVGTVAGVVAVGAGSSSASQGYYTLEIASAEFAELPVLEVANALSDFNKRKLGAQLPDLLGPDSACDASSLSVVNTAYYTRHITATMGDSYASALEARAAYQLPTGSVRAETYKLIAAYAFGASAPAAPSSSPLPNESSKMTQFMIDVDKVLAQADANSKLGFTGFKVGYAKGRGNAVSMDYTYAKPVAFAVKLSRVVLRADGTLGLSKLSSIVAERGDTLRSIMELKSGSPLLGIDPFGLAASAPASVAPQASSPSTPAK